MNHTPASEWKIELSAKSSLHSVRFVACQLRAALDRSVDESMAHAMELALVEAYTNAVKHGAPGESLIQVQIERTPCDLRMTVENEGRPFDLSNARLPEVDTDHIDALSSRGRGIHLIRSLMDDVHMDASQGRVRLSLVKHIGSTELGPAEPAICESQEVRKAGERDA
jgi:serine/threonine-protein kinase RsbW